jgi:hypothetical protein
MPHAPSVHRIDLRAISSVGLPQIVGFWFERNMQHCVHCFYAVHTNSTPQKYKAKQVNSRTSSKRYCQHTHTHTHTQLIHTLVCVEMEALEAVEACGVKERVCERTVSVVWEHAAPQVSVSVLLCE